MKGSLAAVFRATQFSLEREVAVKVFRPGVLHENESFGERLLEAARLSGRIEHPNIARIHECGKDERAPAVVQHGTGRRRIPRGINRKKWAPRSRRRPPYHRTDCQWPWRRRKGRHLPLGYPALGILINGNGNVKILDLGLGQVLQEGQQSSMIPWWW